MAIDTAAVGTAIPVVNMTVERGRLRLFCKAIGDTDPIYTDVAAARAAGHRDLPVPPTFLCAVQHERPDPFDWLTAIGGDLARVLHGEQSFTYHAMAYAGDHLTMAGSIADIYHRKGGALTFIVRDVAIRRGHEAVADLQDAIIVREGTA